VRAVDTNVVVRYLLADEPRQAATARRTVDRHSCWVSLTVLLETEWVLRGAAGLSRREVHRLLLAFAGLPTISIEQPAVAARALDLFAAGMDFADALHGCVADAAGAAAFVTFDRRLVSKARKAGLGFVGAP
jgi:predicted nucleic-acid-binding protein